jgi:NAD(P)H dehydrogenase (quinone)
MILITGAGGKTGQAIIRALASSSEPVRALVHHAGQIPVLEKSGASEIRVGNLLDARFILDSFSGIRAVYHICPNMSPDELSMAEIMLNAAQKAGVEHFVYHSVLHPQVEAMPHHWLKMRVEETLFSSGLPFTILQPAPYMQNIHGYWQQIKQEGIYVLPYAPHTRLSMVDLEDVATVAAKVLTTPEHSGAIYELSGPQALTQLEVAETIARALGHPVQVKTINRQDWDQQAQLSDMPDYARKTLLKMFEYYERFGFVGNPHILEYLLGHRARFFSEFIEHLITGE